MLYTIMTILSMCAYFLNTKKSYKKTSFSTRGMMLYIHITEIPAFCTCHKDALHAHIVQEIFADRSWKF